MDEHEFSLKLQAGVLRVVSDAARLQAAHGVCNSQRTRGQISERIEARAAESCLSQVGDAGENDFGFEESGALTYSALNRVATIADEPQRNVPRSLSEAAEERLRVEMDGSEDSTYFSKITGGSN